MGIGHGRWTGRGIVMVCLVAAIAGLWGAAAGQDAESTEASEGPSIEGRYGVISEAGGAVWAFLPGGRLTLVGPGDLVADGTWRHADAEGAFDAAIHVALTGQTLSVLGALAPDGQRIALHVRASSATSPQDGVSWPAESRLIGERIGMLQEGPSPTPTAEDCLSPAWESGSVVEWDPCASGPERTPDPSVVPVPVDAADGTPDPDV